jgi:class 3 adenylate cyclase
VTTFIIRDVVRSATFEDNFEAELRGEMNLKGIQASVQVYRVIGSRTGLGEP